MEECLEVPSKEYPKQKDLEWKVKTTDGKWVASDKPPYMTDMDTTSRELTHLEVVK